MNAAGFSDSPHLFFSGYDKKGEWFQLFQIGFGGIPGRPIGDGPDGHSLWPGFTNVPNEFIEAYFPLRMDGINRICSQSDIDLSKVSQVMHGTTVATNAVLTGPMERQ